MVHCRTEQQADEILKALKVRFAECGLEIHPDKTKIVYCKDLKRKAEYPNVEFDFLGYTFRQRMCMNPRDGKRFMGFTPGISKTAMKSMRMKIKRLKWCGRTELSLNEIAYRCNPILRGWVNYYGKYHRSELYKFWRYFNRTLVAWVMRKYKRFRGHKTEAGKFLRRVADKQPNLFEHWKIGMAGSFA